jgi:tetratricopeptide (TPR) repeat protein
MKARTILLGLTLLPLFCAITIPARAQTANPQDTLTQYVADLQSNPNDTALRGKIIVLAQTMKTPPAVPADAYELVGRAAYAIKNANTDADFIAAADAYGKALQLAPWVADYYFNQGVAYEKAKHFDEAIADFNWYLMAAPNAKDANGVHERIGGLKYAKEKAGDEQRAAAAHAAYESSPEGRLQALLTKIDGRRYVCIKNNHISDATSVIDVKGGYFVFGYLQRGSYGRLDGNPIRITGPTTTWDLGVPPGAGGCHTVADTISEDGGQITSTCRWADGNWLDPSVFVWQR